jgi:hypothetical protein
MVLELAALRHYAVKHRIGPPLSIVRTASGALMERGVVLIFFVLPVFW